jgi:putative ABC transport system ATP-binding protein
MSLMQSLNREHQQTFVIVTHDPAIAARCHRTIHMHDGQVVRDEVAAGD